MAEFGGKNYARLCGWALALAHGMGGDAAAQSGYLGASAAFDESDTGVDRAGGL